MLYCWHGFASVQVLGHHSDVNVSGNKLGLVADTLVPLPDVND